MSPFDRSALPRPEPEPLPNGRRAPRGSRSARSALLALLLLATLAPTALDAQRGDRAGEAQPENWRRFDVPPAPALTAEEQQATFRLPPRFRIECFAYEPLVVDPIAVTFDRDGRAWVVELRGYMPTVTGEGEMEPVGQVVVLEDLDQDGRADRSTVFLDRLVNPRALAIVEGGVLVAEPPVLWYCRDVDGDLRADLRTEIGRYGDPNPDHLEHTENGLRRGPDGWLLNAKSTRELRVTLDAAGNPHLEERATDFRGQWGVFVDDRGRVYSNSNSNSLFVDLWPAHFLRRGAAAGRAVGQPHVRGKRLVDDESVYSLRVNPGINRGYQKGMLRRDGRLARTTSVSGGCIQRGDQFGPDFIGDAFIPEPAGNVVAHFRIEELDGGVDLRATQVLTPDPDWGERAFLASTDERFRPVDCVVAPDGSLIVVDLYRGILQHRQFVTSYLAKQIEERGLDTPVGLGRIWRVVRDDRPIDRSAPSAHFADLDACIASLGHRNGWVRDTAQRILTEGLVARGARCPGSIAASVEERLAALRVAATNAASPWGRVHALRTLGEFTERGFGGLDLDLLEAALGDGNGEVRIAALRALEGWIRHCPTRSVDDDRRLLHTITGLLRQSPPDVRVQAAFTLGELHPAPGPAERPPSVVAAVRHLEAIGSDPWIALALLSGLGGREQQTFDTVFGNLDRRTIETGRATSPDVIAALAASAALASPRENLPRLLSSYERRFSDLPRSHTDPILVGLACATSARAFPVVPIDRVPAPLTRTGRGDLAEEARAAWRTIAKKIHVGSERSSNDDRPRPELRTRIERGREAYALCATCHGGAGEGLVGLGPPLVGSERIVDADRSGELIRLVLDGVTGPLEIEGATIDATMPGVRRDEQFDDEAIASLITFLRHGLPHPTRAERDRPPIDAARVARVRTETADRTAAWTDAELRASTASPRRPLFDGRSLVGWTKYGGDATYRIEDGCIVGTTAPNTANTFLCTDERFGDFDLVYEFRVDPILNSGVQIRSRVDTSGRVRGSQVEIDVDPQRARFWSGGIYEEGGRGWLDDLSDDPVAREAARPDDWNPVRVRAIGGRVEVWIHGTKTADLLDAESLEGVIGLQVHRVGERESPLEVRWRNLEITTLGRSDWRPVDLVGDLRVTGAVRSAPPGSPQEIEVGRTMRLIAHGGSTVFIHRIEATLEPGVTLRFDGVTIDAEGIHVQSFDGTGTQGSTIAEAVAVDGDGTTRLPETVILREGSRLVVTQGGRRLIEVNGCDAPHTVETVGEAGVVTLERCDRLTRIAARR